MVHPRHVPASGFFAAEKAVSFYKLLHLFNLLLQSLNCLARSFFDLLLLGSFFAPPGGLLMVLFLFFCYAMRAMPAVHAMHAKRYA